MEKSGIYSKTSRGIQEISDRALRLPPRLRQLLIMVDGESDVATLTERFDAMDDVPGQLSALEALGLIQTGTGAATAAGDGGLRELRRNLSRLVIDSLGPNGEALAVKIENAGARDELLGHCRDCQTIVRNMLGKTRAEAFWAKAEQMLG